MTSPSVWSTKTGASRSSRINVGACATAGVSGGDARLDARPLLCTRKPSYARTTGCTASTYVIMRPADCDSPIAMTCFTRSGPSTRGVLRLRATAPACEYMSYE
jgi:hypothetical protein